MANIKSAKKRIKVTEKKTLRNKMIKSALKTAIKKFEVAVQANNKAEAATLYVEAARALDMSASKGVVHKNMAASGVGEKSYVSIGSKISSGDVLCIVEAMKLMNEIESEVSGEIVDILVQNGNMVEYGQPLFKVRRA